MTAQNYFSIDQLIFIVENGGTVKTGIDVYTNDGILLLDRNIIVKKTKILEIIKANGIENVPVTDSNGGCWDGNGNLVIPNQNKDIDNNISDEDKQNGANDSIIENVNIKNKSAIFPDAGTNEIESRLLKIYDIKKQAREKYNKAKDCIQKTFQDVKENQGEFDYNKVEEIVEDLIEFLGDRENYFSYLNRELFVYNEYLYNHSINVCSVGYAMLIQFNNHFSKFIDQLIKNNANDIYNPFEKGDVSKKQSYYCYYPNEIKDICIGFFLHDIGKVLVKDSILNKEGKLSPKEYEEVKKHSYEYGPSLLEKNCINNSIIKNIVQYHHSELVGNESNCYPDKEYLAIPPYTKICKIADIYDAMTSKRSYNEAVNPINGVTELFRKYAKRDQLLQFILHSFVKSIGIYPPGSIVYLRNGQMAYILDSHGPIVIPFTNKDQLPLKEKPDPIDISSKNTDDSHLIDSRKSVKTHREVYKLLPEYILKTISE